MGKLITFREIELEFAGQMVLVTEKPVIERFVYPMFLDYLRGNQSSQGTAIDADLVGRNNDQWILRQPVRNVWQLSIFHQLRQEGSFLKGK